MDKRPLILHINTVARRRNGVGQIVHALSDIATSKGFNSHIIAGYGESEDSDFIVEHRNVYYLNVLKSRLFEDDGFIRTTETDNLNRHIISLKPDLVHLHNLHGYYCDLPSLRSTLDYLGVPVVQTLHDLWFFTGRCAYPPDGNCLEQTDSSCARCPHADRYPAKWVHGKSRLTEKIQFLKQCTVVAPSKWVADRSNTSKPLIIPNGVDLNIFHGDNGYTERNGFVAIATTWNPRKGIDDIVKLADALPDNEYISIIGKNAPKHIRIKNLGPIDNPSLIADILKHHKALLSCAREEAFGMSVAEALATGTPAIVRKGTAPEEQLYDKSFAVDMSNTDEVLHAMSRLDDYTFPRNIPSTVQMADAYYELYTRLLNS